MNWVMSFKSRVRPLVILMDIIGNLGQNIYAQSLMREYDLNYLYITLGLLDAFPPRSFYS